LLAWLADEAGSEFYTARVRVIDSGADLADVVPDASSAVVWTQDASAFYYVRLDRNHRPAGVFRHGLSTPVAADVRVFTEADPGFFISIGRHSSGCFGDISAHDHETSEAWLMDLSAPNAEPTLIAARQSGVQYEAEHHPDFNGGPALIIRTNADGAEDFKIVWAPLTTPGRAYWRDLIPHRPGVYILSARARGWPAAHRSSAPCEWRGARYRIRRGGLCARHQRRLRVCDQSPTLHLFVDDHAGRSLRVW
jgi:oligopeptidase B